MLDAHINRRRIIQGALWATPAVIIATAVPAAAVSIAPASGTPLPAGTGMSIGSLNASFEPSRWNSTIGATVTAINSGTYFQNSGNTAPTTTSVILTAFIPVGSLTTPRWGIGQGNGIESGQPWSLASGPTVSNGVATLTLVYTGAPLAAWQGISLSNFWVESGGNTSGQNVTVTLSATYQGGYTSTASKSDAA